MSKAVSIREVCDEESHENESHARKHKDQQNRDGGQPEERTQDEPSGHQDLLAKVRQHRKKLASQSAAPADSDLLLARRKKTLRQFAALDEATGKKEVREGDELLDEKDVHAYKQYKNFRESTLLNKVYQWDVVDNIYSQNRAELEKNIKRVKEYVYPMANSIYYNRKVELTNLVNEKRELDQNQVEFVLEQTRNKENIDAAMEKETDKLVKIMHRYDIRHPLRGEKWEDCPTMKQSFNRKILDVVAFPNSFIKYKTDQRLTLDNSEIRSEEYLARLNAEFQKERTIMKYRLFGREGLTEHEWKKVVEWGIALRQKDEGGHPLTVRVAVKKKVHKKRVNQYTGCVEEVKSEKSGSNDSAYTFEDQFVYQDNLEGDPKHFNAGFEIRPLDKEIFGAQAARESVRKHNLRASGGTQRTTSNVLLTSSARRKQGKAHQRGGMQGDLQSSTASLNYDFGEMRKGSDSRMKTRQALLEEQQMPQEDELHSQRVGSNRIATRGHHLQPGKTAQEQGGEKLVDSSHGRHGETTHYQSTMAITDETPLSRNPAARTAIYSSALQTGGRATSVASSAQKVLGPSRSRLSCHKDILMPNISKQFALQRVHQPAREAGRRTALTSYQHGTNDFAGSALHTQSQPNDYQDYFVANEGAAPRSRGSLAHVASDIVGKAKDHTRSLPATTRGEQEGAGDSFPRQGGPGALQQSVHPFGGSVPQLLGEGRRGSTGLPGRQEQNYVVKEYIVDNRTGARIPLNEPKRNDLAPFLEARREMQRSRLLRVSRHSPPGTAANGPKKKRRLPSITGDEERQGRSNTKMTNTMYGRRFSSQPPVQEVHDGPGAGLYQKMEWAQKRTLIDQIQKTNVQRKEASGGRFNRTFQAKTPSVRDPDIRALISQYPMHAEDEEDDGKPLESKSPQGSKAQSKSSAQYAERYRQIHQLDRVERNKQLRKDIEQLARHVDHINTKDQGVYRNLVHKMVLNDFRSAELGKVTDLLKEIEFADPLALYGMFDYRQKTALERLGVEVEVMKEFRASELEPSKLQINKKPVKQKAAQMHQHRQGK